MTTRLTWIQEKKLQTEFEGKKLILLYKATVHQFSYENMLKKCQDQGPTVTVIYSGNHILGAYLQELYQEKRKTSNFLFIFQGTKMPKYKIAVHDINKLFYWSSEMNINLDKKVMTVDSQIAKVLGLSQNSISFQECEVFRCEDILNERTLQGVTEYREDLLSFVKTYKLIKPYSDLVNQIRILLVGPIGAGKSSFVNSVKSVFRGHVTHQVLVGSNTHGTSEMYRTYSIKDGKNGNTLPFILCDSVGLGEEEEGLCIDDVVPILKGHVPDRYQLHSKQPITPSHANYIHNPLLKDRIHCVAFVLDATSVEYLCHEVVTKIKRIRREVIKCGVVYVALLTNVDRLDLITKDDFMDIYRCMPVKLKLEAVHKKLGFALCDILAVSNYTSEWELDVVKDYLILSVLKQMLWAANDFLEDLPL